MVDLSHEITLESLKNLPKSVGRNAGTYPTKTSINLAQHVQSSESKRATVIAFIAAVFIILVACKFLVVDPLSSAISSNAEVAAAESQLSALTAENEDFAAINQEYSRYVASGLSEEEAVLADRGKMLSLVRSQLLNVGTLKSITVTGNTVTVEVADITMDRASTKMNEIKTLDMVQYVTFSGAKDGADSSDDPTSVTFVITLKSADGSDASAATEDDSAIAENLSDAALEGASDEQ